MNPQISKINGDVDENRNRENYPPKGTQTKTGLDVWRQVAGLLVVITVMRKKKFEESKLPLGCSKVCEIPHVHTKYPFGPLNPQY